MSSNPPKTVSFSEGGKVRAYDVVHVFGPSRVLINFDGVFAFADLRYMVSGGGDVWELSAIPARDDEEKKVLASFIAPTLDKSVVTVTPPGDLPPEGPETD